MPVSCLQGLDATGRVIYMGSFNKTMFPGLRLGFLIAPHSLIESFSAARTHVDGHPPAVIQSVLAEFITSGAYAAHLRRMRGIYIERRDALIAALRRHIPALRVGVHDRGLHFVAELPQATNDRAYAAPARANGIVVPALSDFYLGEGARPGLLFGFACTPVVEIGPAAKRLAATLAAEVAR
jgi:GntR family transcriptional regulator/MocR family aminotransferase